ncbi:hypothetical protein PanWU01x14_328020 [Parasponia andersonii]|uniref:Ubiquitin-like protease family profile domain-containing protein n=1 Tax=Parasponia andersonii TaxID=3476 RepID=A0A2P5AJ02_PARAD|nr:hypothetical protein PanWU01x14_328020 [Parasponia andersonii]
MMDCINVFKIKKLVTKVLLNPRETEKEFYEHIYHDPHHSLGSTGVEEERIDVEDEDENKKEAAAAKRAAEEADIFDAPTNKVEEELLDDVPHSHKFYLELKTDIAELKSNQTELKANQVILNDKLDRLLKMMEEIKVHRQPTGSESETTQSDVLPEGYQPGEDVVIRTPTKEHTLEEQQTLGVKELQLAEVATVKFGRKKRTPWKWLTDEIDLPAYMLTVYDSDQALYDDARVEEAMRPMMKMLPYFLLNVEGVADRDDLDLTTTTKPRDFDVRRLSPNIDLPAYMLTVYDSDQALYDDARVEEAMRPMMKMLPYFLLNVEGVADRDDLDLTTTTKPRDFDVRSGDCGVFFVKHLECLLADIPLSNVVDDVMQHSRQKLCVDLFYQNIEP